MLAALLVAAAVSTAVCLLLLLIRPPSRTDRPPTAGPAAALLSALPLATGPLAVAALGGSLRGVAAAAVALAVADVGWLRLTRSWSWQGHAAWVAATTVSAAYLAYMLLASLQPGLGTGARTLSLLLWLVELLAFALGAAFTWEVLDTLARTRWTRRLVDGVDPAGQPTPFVSLHVPAHNEPPDMLIATIDSLRALDYPTYEIVVIDNNTEDDALWQPVRDHCAAHGITFLHLVDWPGFKSGALNQALRTATDPRAEVIGVVDADYVDPDWLARCAPLFAQRPELAFVQTPQNYREWAHAPYYRRLFYSYEYFFAVSQRSRNELDAAIFGGTMGLIRRSALEQVGGWDEWCITEDAEVSLKLLRAGWTGQHVERPFGHGIMPLTFEALKRQRFRWAFGGVQILKAHWRSLLPWDRSPDNRLSPAQRISYLFGSLAWFADVLGLVFAGLLLVGGLSLVFGDGLVIRRLAGLVLLLPALLVLLTLVRAVAVLRERTDAGWRDAVGALGIWLSLGPTVARACVQALAQREGVFLRTPKTREQAVLRDAVRANRGETVAGAGLLGMGVLAPLAEQSVASAALAVLLLWHGTGLVAAPVNSLSALRADLPSQLRRRRATERLRERAARVRPVPVGLGVVGVAAAGLAVALLLAPPAVVAPERDVLADLRGEPRAPAPAVDALPTPPVEQPTQPAARAEPSEAGSSPPSPAPAPAGTVPAVVPPTPAPTPAPAPAAPAPAAPAAPAPGGAPGVPAEPGPTTTPAQPPAASPSARPTAAPTNQPPGQPTERPGGQPTSTPTAPGRPR